jgi:hypothetical protein
MDSLWSTSVLITDYIVIFEWHVFDKDDYCLIFTEEFYKAKVQVEMFHSIFSGT